LKIKNARKVGSLARAKAYYDQDSNDANYVSTLFSAQISGATNTIELVAILGHMGHAIENKVAYDYLQTQISSAYPSIVTCHCRGDQAPWCCVETDTPAVFIANGGRFTFMPNTVDLRTETKVIIFGCNSYAFTSSYYVASNTMGADQIFCGYENFVFVEPVLDTTGHATANQGRIVECPGFPAGAYEAEQGYKPQVIEMLKTHLTSQSNDLYELTHQALTTGTTSDAMADLFERGILARQASVNTRSARRSGAKATKCTYSTLDKAICG